MDALAHSSTPFKRYVINPTRVICYIILYREAISPLRVTSVTDAAHKRPVPIYQGRQNKIQSTRNAVMLTNARDVLPSFVTRHKERAMLTSQCIVYNWLVYYFFDVREMLRMKIMSAVNSRLLWSASKRIIFNSCDCLFFLFIFMVVTL